MVLNLLCITNGGIPLFSRCSGTKNQQLDFSSFAPLNGVDVFAKAHDVSFHSTTGIDFTIHWKTFESIVLILVAKGTQIHDTEGVLDLISRVLIFIVGKDEISTIKNVEKLKRDLKPCYPLLNNILSKVCEDCDFLDLIQVHPICLESIQDKLEEWSESILSQFCALIIQGKVVAASQPWWSLSPCEKKLIVMLISSHNGFCTSSDIPVFLPDKSPKTAFRLVSCCLVDGVWLSALCGPNPDLRQFEKCCVLIFSPVTVQLRTIHENKKFIDFSEHISALLLINQIDGKYCLYGEKLKNDLLKIMKYFYCDNVEPLAKRGETCNHKIKEVYMCEMKYKLHALIAKDKVICAVYPLDIPTFTARMITKDTYSQIVNSKTFNW